ncbi:MAG: gamma-glutamyltransferase, partial [Bacteroidota bacterium]
LVQPAIRLAKEGVIVNDFQHEDFVLLRNILQVDPKAAPIFFPDGEFIQLGDRQFMPEQADFLEYLGKEGPDFFYKGEIARTICEDHLEGGGFLRRHDFETYEAVFRKPLQFWFRDNQILTNPLPSTGGMSLLMAFHAYDERGDAADIFEKEHVAILVEVLQQLDRFKKHPQAFQTWLTENLPEFGKFQFGLPKDRKWGSTTHFNIVDEKGMAVSLTSTNGEGSGYFVRHTGVQLNNMLGESALLPNGFHSWTPDHRLSSMMSPSMVLDKSGLLEVVMGSGGASRIPTAIFQVLLNLLQYDYSLNKSVDLPRVHLEHGELNIEAANNLNFASDVYPKKKEWTDYSLFFGGVHALRRTASFWEAVGDHRRDGVALLS